MSTATTPKRPQALAVKDLSQAVEKAVRLVSDKHKVKFSPEFHVGPIIMGRQLLQAEIGTGQAEQIATEITQHLTQGGLRKQFCAIALQGQGLKGNTGWIFPVGSDLMGDFVRDMDCNLHRRRIPHQFVRLLAG